MIHVFEIWHVGAETIRVGHCHVHDRRWTFRSSDRCPHCRERVELLTVDQLGERTRALLGELERAQAIVIDQKGRRRPELPWTMHADVAAHAPSRAYELARSIADRCERSLARRGAAS